MTAVTKNMTKIMEYVKSVRRFNSGYFKAKPIMTAAESSKNSYNPNRNILSIILFFLISCSQLSSNIILILTKLP